MLLVASLLALCLVAGPTQAQAGTKAMGIDVSRFQGAINWPSVAGAGIGFACVSAVEFSAMVGMFRLPPRTIFFQPGVAAHANSSCSISIVQVSKR